MKMRVRFGMCDVAQAAGLNPAARSLVAALVLVAIVAGRVSAAPPNVVLVITDDQGYGDLGAHGNTMLKTPNLDRLHSQSIRLTNFHVDPTCAPTRAALMTGRYSTRTGVWHTIGGRSLMSPKELTLAEVFSANGYATGQFGKWHLGDNAPLRPQDQGFDESLCCGGGGVTQVPDWFGNDYFDDTYRRNGVPEKCDGYCTDVWFREGISFIERSHDRPFFCYIATNAPHSPYLVADEWKKPYLEAGVSEPMASFYGMIANIDDNVGKLLKRLDDLKLANNTIVIFMTDNGSAAGTPPAGAENAAEGEPWRGFDAGMRGQKGSEYDGGHRVPFFIRWPIGSLEGGRDVDQLTAHIDVLPTLIELCGIRKPQGPGIDGRSVVKLLHGDKKSLRDRTLFVHSQRVEIPEKWRQSAVMTDRWRLVNGKELFDIHADPRQKQNVAQANAKVVADLRAAYERWWTSLTPVFDESVAIEIGSEFETVTHLTAHDWHAPPGEVMVMQDQILKDPAANGFWVVDFVRPGRYEITLRSRPEHIKGVPLNAVHREIKVDHSGGGGSCNPEETVSTVTGEFEAGQTKFQTFLKNADGVTRGAYFVDVKYVGERNGDQNKGGAPKRPNRKPAKD